MLRKTATRGISHMVRVAKPEARKHQPVPQNPLDTNNILKISLALTESGQGLSQPRSCTLPHA